MECKKTVLFFFTFLLTYSDVFSLNILGVFPYTGKSHFFVYGPYLRELAAKDHNVTVISYFPREEPLKNYHDISLAGKTKILESVFTIDRSYWGVLQSYLYIYEIGKQNCQDLLSNKKVQSLYRSEAKFDLVVTEQFNTDCSLGLAYKLRAPVVGITLHVPMPWHYERYGVHFNPSYMQFQSLERESKPTLLQRIEGLIFHNLCNILYKYICQRINQVQIQEYFDIPPLEELARDIKIVLLYTNFLITGPTILPPKVIEVAGFHIQKAKELPEDLKNFIEQSEHGVLYISFGTMVQAATIPKEKYEAITGAISKLRQRVIWKWDEKVLPGNPKNVYVTDWLPQNDILAHPNVVAFFSHSGLLSIIEATHHGVPMIGMPVFGDQPKNALGMEEGGLGVKLHFADLTEETLSQKIKTVLDPEFRRKVKELSRVWHQQPSPMDRAIYWTEFAARTKNYTFRSPASTVPMYQYLYLDIFSVFVFIMFIVIWGTKSILCLFKRQQKQSTKLKKK